MLKYKDGTKMNTDKNFAFKMKASKLVDKLDVNKNKKKKMKGHCPH